MVHCAAVEFLDGLVQTFRGAGGKDVAADLEHTLCDAYNLVERLAFAVDDLRHAMAQMTVMVDVCVGHVLERQVLEPVERFLDIYFPCAEALEEFCEV
jgi:hypothetical protein